MPRDNEHNPDPNANAARIVRESTASKPDKLPKKAQAAFEQWLSTLQNIDQRTETLLRAAFEAGWEGRDGPG